jgi:hypothetical protein
MALPIQPDTKALDVELEVSPNRTHQVQPRRFFIWLCHQGVFLPPKAARNANRGKSDDPLDESGVRQMADASDIYENRLNAEL